MLQKWRTFWRLRQAQRLSVANRNKACVAYQKLLEFAPKYPYTYYHFARYWADEDDWQKAEQYINQAIELDPQQPVFYTYQGIVAYHLKNYEKALQALQHSLTLDSTNQLTQNYLALNHLALNHIEEFHTILQKSGLFESFEFQTELLFALENKSRT